MSSDDIVAMVHSLQREVCSYRVSNVYDVDGGKTYMLKLTSGAKEGSKKIYLLLESGVRFHTTQYSRTKPTIPSQFTMKLRKHIRTKRLTSITQLGNGDRVIDLFFGEGEQYGFHLIVELYASGNIILTDYHYTILSLLRIHRYEEEQVRVAVKQTYPIQTATSLNETMELTKEELLEWIQSSCNETQGKKKKKMSLKQLLLRPGSGFSHLGPSLVEHCISIAKLDASTKLLNTLTLEDAQGLLEALDTTRSVLDQLKNPNPEDKKGFVIVKEIREEADVSEDTTQTTAEDCKQLDVVIPQEGCSKAIHPIRMVYDEFVPVVYAHHENKPRIEFDTFDEAVDEFFSKVESQQAETRKTAAETAAQKKFERIQHDQDARVQALRELQDISVHQAQLIELNKEDVENVLLVVRSALDSGMDWDELKNLVKMEQKNGNPVANLIHSLDFKKKSVTMILEEGDEDENDGQSLAKLVEIDISMSALANARELYTRKKKSAQKESKTIEASEKALVAAKKNAQATIQKQQMKQTIHVMRKIQWWEKFHWFITSENYLVLAGHDAQQNELLVKRYLRKGDVYVHADIHGAASCIVRNRNPERDIPQLSLEQAGTMTICRSAAWTSHVITSAWWVYHHQVSKTAPTGEYLTTGSFMIRGKKNFIAPARLEMGLAILFKVDESCIARHVGERKIRGEEDDLPIQKSTEEKEGDSVPHLRKFERTKLKKEKQEIETELKLASVALEDLET